MCLNSAEVRKNGSAEGKKPRKAVNSGRKGMERDLGRLRVIVAGGSLGGLFAAHELLRAGCDVEVFERSPRHLRDRGAGLVLHGETLRFLERHGLARRDDVSVPSRARQELDREGRVKAEEPDSQLLTSWGTLFRRLCGAFPEDRYHKGKRLVALDAAGEKAVAWFADGSREHGDILVCADGAGSTCRRLLLPDVEPAYSGYVAWRGLVPEERLSSGDRALFAGRFTSYYGPGTQILCYLIPGPGGELGEGSRRFNWVWYWNVSAGEQLRGTMTDREGIVRDFIVPEGFVRQEVAERQIMIARESLPPPFRRLVEATAEPFIQPIYDLTVPRMVFGRACLVGDAAFVPRPHAAASTSQAAINARELAELLDRHGADVTGALAAWEPAQLRLGERIHRLGVELGSKQRSNAD